MPTRQETFNAQNRTPIANDDKRREAYGLWCCFDKPNIGDLARHADARCQRQSSLSQV